MTGRARLLAAFAHEEPDRPPFDVAATASSAIEPDARARLLGHLGRAPREDEDGLLELLDVLEPDLGRVPLGGGPGWLWRGLSLRSTDLDELERTEWPAADPALFHGLRDRALENRDRGRAVVLDTELGLVDGCQALRGLAGWLEDLLAAPAFADALMEHVTHVCSELLRGALRVLGDLVDVVLVYEDLAGQTRPLVSPELYRRRIRPFHAALVGAVHESSGARVAVHCDGAVAELLPDLVEIGVDAVNPLQTSAAGMEPRRLKREFGSSLVLWGGFDAGAALSFGSPADVDAEARKALGALAPGGGYVFAPAYPIDASVPAENVLALVRAARGGG